MWALLLITLPQYTLDVIIAEEKFLFKKVEAQPSSGSTTARCISTSACLVVNRSADVH